MKRTIVKCLEELVVTNDGKTLIIHYKSHRGLIDFAVGLTKAVGAFYKENLRVTKLGTNRL